MRMHIATSSAAKSAVNQLLTSGNPQICETLSHKFAMPPEMLVSKLSFSHIREIK